ncbi:hypothetical protein [Natrinema sp. DC36]|uniref:hypothetical protein n=1 Tax=Natrinema sp. DC36 TaxID=2878680 RepID=UPI001CF04AD9|nr:hypothetical protein [Natrinema sp. DC36]
MSTNMTPARQQNRDALHGSQKDIGLAELNGFQLAPETVEEFLTRTQEEVRILDMADTMPLDRLEADVPKLGVPMLSGGTRDEEGNRTQNSGAESGEVKFNTTDKQYYILVEPKRDALKNTHYANDQFGQYIIDEFIQRWANDVGLIGIRANADTGNLASIGGDASLDETWNGWIAIAEGEDTASDRIGLEDTAAGEVDTMPEVDMGSAPIDTKMFNDMVQTVPQRYRDPEKIAFLCSPDQVQQYHYDLTQREDVGGAAVLMGDGDVTPFEYDIIGVNGWPNSYAMLTNPENLAFGLFREMEVDQTTNSDKVNENVLHSRNWLEGQFDYQIKELQAGALSTNIQDPVA